MKLSKLTLTALTTMTLSATAFAATSGTLLLQGTVNDIYDIVVTPNAATHKSLDIVAGESNLNVASVAETSNNLNGYKIRVSSPTGGELRHTVDATKKTNYTISYDGGSSITPTTSGVVVKTVTSLSGLTTNTSLVAVDVVALSNAVSGTYQDTLTISIEAN